MNGDSWKLWGEIAEEIYDDAPFGYLATKLDGAIVAANRTFLTWLGQRREDVLTAKRFQDLLTVGGKIFYETHYAPLLRMQGFANEIAFDFLCSDGSQLPGLVNAVQKADGVSGSLVIRMYIFNASDRRRYEQELLHAKRKADAAAEELRRLNQVLERRVVAEV
ncbi:MAG TPA: PAS domain-containing protein, partial [Salinarimonas sp.]|nr:PAS domain-containing protein [Salinarimonas sp.]